MQIPLAPKPSPRGGLAWPDCPQPQAAVEERDVTQHKRQGEHRSGEGNQGKQSGVRRPRVSSPRAGGQAQRFPG